MAFRSRHDGAASSTGDGGTRAAHLVIERSAVGSVEADEVRLEQAAAQRLNAGRASLDRSVVVVAAARRATIRQSAAGVVVARSVACDEVHVGFLAAPVVRGDVYTWFDLRTAFAIGLGMAFGKALIAGSRALVRRAL